MSTNPVTCAEKDSDGDGIPDIAEDEDKDGIPDYFEVRKRKGFLLFFFSFTVPWN